MMCLKHQQMMEKYRIVACHGASLYCCLCKMEKIHPVYHYSWQWFMQMFMCCLQKCEPSYMIEKRVVNMIECLNEECYKTVSCELFEKHRLMFSFLMITNMMKMSHQITEEHWNFLTTSCDTSEPCCENPCNWLPTHCWNNIWCELKRL